MKNYNRIVEYLKTKGYGFQFQPGLSASNSNDLHFHNKTNTKMVIIETNANLTIRFIKNSKCYHTVSEDMLIFEDGYFIHTGSLKEDQHLLTILNITL